MLVVGRAEGEVTTDLREPLNPRLHHQHRLLLWALRSNFVVAHLRCHLCSQTRYLSSKCLLSCTQLRVSMRSRKQCKCLMLLLHTALGCACVVECGSGVIDAVLHQLYTVFFASLTTPCVPSRIPGTNNKIKTFDLLLHKHSSVMIWSSARSAAIKSGVIPPEDLLQHQQRATVEGERVG